MTAIETGTGIDPVAPPAADPLVIRGAGSGGPGGIPPAPDAPPGTSTSRLRPALSAVGWTAVGLTGFLLLWQLGASRSVDLPSPADGLHKLQHLLGNPLYDNGPNDKGIGLQLWVSLLRVAKGFGLAVVVGVPLGVSIGASRRAWSAVNPIVQLLRPVSPLAWFPLWLAVSRDPAKASVIVIFITALWPTVVNSAAGVATVPAEQRNVAAVFKFGRLAYLRHVLVPNALPGIITGMRLSMGIAWMVIVAVEMLSGSTGIGAYVWMSYNVNDLSAVAAAILIIGAVGLVLDAFFLRLARLVSLETTS
jgi:nitrate/nitrite transport system permease protein